MSCGCKQPDRTPLWTPIPPFRAGSPGDDVSHYPLPGENIDCFMKRAPENGLDDAREKIPNLIDNTSLVADKNGNVDTTFRLTPNSSKTVVTWRVWTDGQQASPPGLNFNTATGRLHGTVPESSRNKNYKVEIRAYEANESLIDSRQYNFYPKAPAKGEEVQFVWPMVPKGRVTSGFGPRTAPATGASKKHKGIDISIAGSALGDIVAAADGVVMKAGPATGFGNAIYIEHRDASGKVVAVTVYGHMNEYYVKAGQKVAAGQKIAKEGNAGIGSAAHLHFELHRGKLGNPVDPLPYLNGTHVVDGEIAPVEVKDSVMVAGEQNVDGCPDELPNQAESVGDKEQPPPSNLSKKEVYNKIKATLDADATLTPDDRRHLLFVAGIESNYRADAKNPESSARGVYQMLDKIAATYYARIGYPNPTIEQRNDPVLATKAQIEFYKREQKKYWTDFVSSGKTKINGRTLAPEVAQRYANLTQGEFTYGLIHHDGVGNAVAGKDMQGVDYYRRKMASM